MKLKSSGRNGGGQAKNTMAVIASALATMCMAPAPANAPIIHPGCKPMKPVSANTDNSPRRYC